MRVKRDLKFDVQGSKFKKPRTSDLEPLSVANPARRVSLACLALHAPKKRYMAMI